MVERVPWIIPDPRPTSRVLRIAAYGAAGTTTTGASSTGSSAVSKLGPGRRSTRDISSRNASSVSRKFDSRRAVVHRHDPARRQALDDRGGLLCSDRGTAADGDDQQVDRTDRSGLLVAQRALAEVAEVTDAQAVELEYEDRVRPPFGAGRLVVLGGDRDDLPDRRLQPARGRAQNLRVAADRLDAVVIDVLMGHQQQIRLDAVDRRIVELHPAARRHRRHVSERVDRHRRLRRAQDETRTVRTTQPACCSSLVEIWVMVLAVTLDLAAPTLATACSSAPAPAPAPAVAGVPGASY